MMTTPRRKRIIMACMATGLTLGLHAEITGMGWLQLPPRNRYLIPEGYAGWLCLTHAVPAAPPLPREEGFRLVRFPPSGVVETSSDGMPGKYSDEYLVITPRGDRRPLGERELGGGHTEATIALPERYTFKFWVSPDVQRDYPRVVDRPRDCGPFPDPPPLP